MKCTERCKGRDRGQGHSWKGERVGRELGRVVVHCVSIAIILFEVEERREERP